MEPILFSSKHPPSLRHVRGDPQAKSKYHWLLSLPLFSTLSPRDTFRRPAHCFVVVESQPVAEPKATPRGGGRFGPGDPGGKGVSPRLDGGGAALGRSVAAGGRVAEGKQPNSRRWKVRPISALLAIHPCFVHQKCVVLGCFAL